MLSQYGEDCVQRSHSRLGWRAANWLVTGPSLKKEQLPGSSQILAEMFSELQKHTYLIAVTYSRIVSAVATDNADNVLVFFDKPSVGA